MSKVPLRLIGIDCATADRRIGLAVGHLRAEMVVLEDATAGSANRPVLGTLRAWIGSSARTLLALDAPLGWPMEMARMLGDHRAGAPLRVPANRMFRRHTDDEIYRRLGKRSLDVGADRIARTAHAALGLLDSLRVALNEEIPLAWVPEFSPRVAAIEVYPAATRRAYDAPVGGGSVAGFGSRLQIPRAWSPPSADAGDAVVCLVAAADFMRRRSPAPTDVELARREGWIWAAERAR